MLASPMMMSLVATNETLNSTIPIGVNVVSEQQLLTFINLHNADARKTVPKISQQSLRNIRDFFTDIRGFNDLLLSDESVINRVSEERMENEKDPPFFEKKRHLKSICCSVVVREEMSRFSANQMTVAVDEANHCLIGSGFPNQAITPVLLTFTCVVQTALRLGLPIVNNNTLLVQIGAMLEGTGTYYIRGGKQRRSVDLEWRDIIVANCISIFRFQRFGIPMEWIQIDWNQHAANNIINSSNRRGKKRPLEQSSIITNQETILDDDVVMDEQFWLLLDENFA